ncbi:MAG TPA: Hpt domain-containing protein [Candidatus Limnocylindrales bacterium]|nr:Hpt domain-containing protein [Candidatus Limnocylindrales bacterium]
MTSSYGDVPVLDPGVIAELLESTGGDEEFVRDLVATYVEEGTGLLGGMRDAVASGDAAAIVRPAHSLKSSSAAIGVMRLSSICRSIEAAGREGRADALGDAVEEAGAAWTASLEALQAAGLAP